MAAVVRAVSYGPDGVSEHEVGEPAALGELRQPGRVLWVDVTGLEDGPGLATVASAFGLHPLAVEDVADSAQRPKLDDYGEVLFLVLRVVPPGTDDLVQTALVLGSDFVLTFHEPPGDVFERVRERIEREGSRLREWGADYLAYALVDAGVDGFFPLLERSEQRLEELEPCIVDGGADQVAQIHAVRTELLTVRRAVLPLKDLVAGLCEGGSGLVSSETRVFLSDVADHVAQIAESLEAQREAAKSLMDLHLSLVGHRTSEITKVLTIIATIFIPLSFIAGVYGMNFNPVSSPFNMPELNAYWGYPVALGLMALVGLLMLGWFWRQGWFGRRNRARRD